jgi:hypothetical protein
MKAINKLISKSSNNNSINGVVDWKTKDNLLGLNLIMHIVILIILIIFIRKTIICTIVNQAHSRG